ncbi:methyltransferase domain-containing protein, partial [Candidatus Woesearchaeota archaeon]
FKGPLSALESEERRKILPPEKILREAGLRKGHTIIDFGCGPGFFSIPALEIVGPSGKVIAIDISQRMIEEISSRTEGLPNIRIVKGDSLRGFSADIVLAVNVLHEIDDKKKFFTEAFEALRNGGKLVIIDWQKKETPTGPPVEHRISKEEAILLAGTKPVEHEINDMFYFLEFPKR